MTLNDPVKSVVEQYATEHGGEFLDGDDTHDVDIAWQYHAEHRNGLFTLVRSEQEYETANGGTAELPPTLVCRVVNYDDEELVDPRMMLVIEDDPNGFQKDVADLSVEIQDTELTFVLDEFELPETDIQRVTLRSLEEGGFRVIENITDMG